MSNNITPQLLREFITYNPDDGTFIWNIRDRAYFETNRAHSVWNARFAGKPVGYITEHGYIACSVLDKKMYLHTIAYAIYYGVFPEYSIDHINHNRQDNRIYNLRDTAFNAKNKSLLSNNKSKIHGVYWCKKRRKWRAQCSVNRKTIVLCSTKDLFEAVCARKAWELRNNFHTNHGGC